VPLLVPAGRPAAAAAGDNPAAGPGAVRPAAEPVGEVTARLYGGLPEADLATAHRVLATVTERANEELAR
jgi:hypothetical protein